MNIQADLTIQKKATSIEFKALHIVKHDDGTKAFIQFQINFDNGTSELFEVQKDSNNFNLFWDKFDTTKVLFEEAFTALNIDVATLPDSTMDEAIKNIEIINIDDVG